MENVTVLLFGSMEVHKTVYATYVCILDARNKHVCTAVLLMKYTYIERRGRTKENVKERGANTCQKLYGTAAGVEVLKDGV